ncbi:MAG TPA: TA system VapC family ribonuclease toxin [Amycolatopsis sp.]|nr:TA system VapC family ribonuclease toxin [Amycolatopsis sp.]
MLDVGVWLAAVWVNHVHHPRVAAWFTEQDGDLCLCRVTQMGLLRLLSNAAVMSDDVVSRTDGCVVDRLRSDERMCWRQEPLQLEPVWRAMSARDDTGHKLSTDDYPAAFAQAAGLPFVTLDTRFAPRYPSVTVHALL